MSADLLREEPTGASGAREPDEWAGPLRPWDGYFGAVWAVTVVLVLGAAEPSWPLRVVAAALVGLTLPCTCGPDVRRCSTTRRPEREAGATSSGPSCSSCPRRCWSARRSW